MNATDERDLDKTRRDASAAKDAVARRTGELIAAVRAAPGLPKPIDAALTRLELAEDTAKAARERLVEYRRATITDDEREAHAYFQRINALVAAHVLGFTLKRDDDDVHPWRVVEPGGKLRPVPHYTTEVATIASAEKLLDGPQQVRYGKYLAELFACDFHRIATANPYARACAILCAVGVPPDAEPPTIAG